MVDRMTTIRFAYFKATDGTEIAINTAKVVAVKCAPKRGFNSLIVCEGDTIEVIGIVGDVAREIAVVS